MVMHTHTHTKMKINAAEDLETMGELFRRG